MVALVVIWATSECHNAGGWPVNGFSQSSGIHDAWNYGIIYPLGAGVLLTARAPGEDPGQHRPGRDTPKQTSLASGAKFLARP
jgi:hypothetical protein